MNLNASTLAETLIASVIIVSIISLGFLLLQQNLQYNYQSTQKVILTQQAKQALDSTIHNDLFFDDVWENSNTEITRDISTVEESELIQLTITTRLGDDEQSVKLTRFVSTEKR